ncbi:MAG: hypothetical protein AB8H12_04470 [Lewinella sp.]
MRLVHLLPILFLFFGFTSCSGSEQTAEEDPVIIQLSALDDFTLPEKPDYAPAYRHADKNALAINAAKYKDEYAIAEYVFEGQHATYKVELTSLQETDGESTYILFVDDKQVASTTNAPTTIDYQLQNHDLGKIAIRPGQRLSVAFNSHSNGKIPEDGGFAFSRGRWTGLKLVLHRRR